jgi:hypothetical protein
MSAEAVRELVWAEIERLRAEADERQRRGDLAGASEIVYGQIPKLESGIAQLARADGEELDPDGGTEISQHHRLLRDRAGRTWVAVPVGDVDIPRKPTKRGPQNPVEGWMPVDEALTLEERRRLILRQAQKALLAGDVETADRLETKALKRVEKALARERSFSLIEESDGRLLLRDGDDTTWIAARLEEVFGPDGGNTNR